MEWQPIETAPIHIHHSYLVSYPVIAYEKEEHMFTAAHYMNGKWLNVFTDEEIKPNYWMPLPTPPNFNSVVVWKSQTNIF